jgi:hypothetical protein
VGRLFLVMNPEVELLKLPSEDTVLLKRYKELRQNLSGNNEAL